MPKVIEHRTKMHSFLFPQPLDPSNSRTEVIHLTCHEATSVSSSYADGSENTMVRDDIFLEVGNQPGIRDVKHVILYCSWIA